MKNIITKKPGNKQIVVKLRENDRAKEKKR